MSLKLKVIGGRHAGQEIAIPRDKPFFVGRAEDCHLRAASEMVSRHHCALLFEAGSAGLFEAGSAGLASTATVRDFNSRNGTFVNGERITGVRPLVHGDHLTIGPLEFEVLHVVAAPVHVPSPKTRAPGDSAVLDVSQWLADEPEPSLEQAAGETMTIRSSHADTGVLRAEGAADQDSAVEAEQSGATERKLPGKLPPIPRKATADSCEAATDVLQKLRRRST